MNFMRYKGAVMCSVTLAVCAPAPAHAVMNGLGQDIFPVGGVFMSDLDMAGNPIVGVSSINLNATGLAGSEPVLQVAGSSFVVNNDGKIGIGTDSPVYKLDVVGGNVRIMSSDPKFLMQNVSGAALGLGLASEVNGELIDYGSNFDQLGVRDEAYPGGFFRIDLRGGASESEFFNIQYIPAGPSVFNRIFALSTTGVGNFASRLLVDAQGVYSDDGTTSLQVNGSGRFVSGIYDNAGTPLISMDAGNRMLYASDGTTVQLDYSVPNGISMGGAMAPIAGSNFLGIDAGAGTSAAFGSNFFGPAAGSGATRVNNSNFLGDSAGFGATDAVNSNFMGNSAGVNATGAYESNFLGYQAGSGATDAANSNFLGNSAGKSATIATYSNFFGKEAGYLASSAADSNFFGNQAGFNAGGAPRSNFFGLSAGSGANGASDSNFLGASAGASATSASNSNFLGNNAGLGASGASNSNFLGLEAGNAAINAANSIFIGAYAGYNDTVDNVTPDPDGTSIAIGRYSGTGGFSDSVAIGHGVINSAAQQLNIGNVLYATGIYASDTQSGAPVAGSVGIGTAAPAAALDIVSTGTAHNEFAQLWRDSGGVILGSMSATGVLMAEKAVTNSASVGGGTTISKIMFGTVTLDPASVAAGGCNSVAVGVTGAAAGDHVVWTAPNGIEAGLVWSAYDSSTADQAGLRLCNLTGSPVDPASASWGYLIIR